MIQMQLMSYQVETNELIDYYKSHKTRIHNLVLHYDKKLTNDKIIEVVRNAINDAIESGVLEKKQPAVTS